MKTNILLHIIIGFLFTSCLAQNDRIENVIMDCSYQSFADNGEEFKKLIADYENLLIREEILHDKSGKSYRQVLLNISDENGFDKVPSMFFSAEWQKIVKPDTEKALECQNIRVKDSTSYDMSKLKQFEQAISKAENAINIQSAVAKELLEVLTEDDFTHDFYKVRTFFIFSLISTNAGISKQIEKPIKYDLTIALKINIDDKNEIFVDTQKVTMDKLKKLVRKYESKNKSESIISLKADRNTKYRIYVDVQNAVLEEINYLRTKLAKEKYKKELTQLTKEQLSEIKEIYPQNLAE